MIKNLLTDYINSYGGYKQNSAYDTGNPHIYACYYLWALYFADKLMPQHLDVAMDHLDRCLVKPGLFGRYPVGYAAYNREYEVISHDELLGIIGILKLAKKVSYLRNVHYLADIFVYAENNGYVFMEQHPNTKSKIKGNIGKLCLYLVNLLFNSDKADSLFEPEVVAIRYRMKPKARAVLVLAAGLKPSFWEMLNLGINLAAKAVSRNTSYAKGTSILLAHIRAIVVINAAHTPNWLKEITLFFILKSVRFKELLALHFDEPGHPINELHY